MVSIQAVKPSNFYRMFMVPPGSQIKLSSHPSEINFENIDKHTAKKVLKQNKERIAELQHILHAQGKQSLLVVLQGMDASGKDGAIKKVLSGSNSRGGVNPIGCQVTSFRAPSETDLKYDYLKRIHTHIPPKGSIGVFHRSHYEDVLSPRVKGLISPSIWKKRYDQINAFERMLSENNVKIVKIFLHVSQEEQMERLKERIHNPRKHWKFSMADLRERKHWTRYIKAYEDAISKTSTEWAPWFIVPADKKWLKNLIISQILVDTMESMRLRLPENIIDMDQIKKEKLLDGDLSTFTEPEENV